MLKKQPLFILGMLGLLLLAAGCQSGTGEDGGTAVDARLGIWAVFGSGSAGYEIYLPTVMKSP